MHIFFLAESDVAEVIALFRLITTANLSFSKDKNKDYLPSVT
jgi:hypothetical protein